MHRPFPGADTRHPLTLPDGTVHTGTVFLKNAIDHPRIEVGDYTYASAHVPPEDWAARLAPYLYPGSPERLVIGRFCQIADGVTFITASANHRRDGFSTFPFAVFDGGFEEGRPSLPQTTAPDTVIGHDVWLGQGVRILPGARLGHGVIAGAGAVPVDHDGAFVLDDELGGAVKAAVDLCVQGLYRLGHNITHLHAPLSDRGWYFEPAALH